MKDFIPGLIFLCLTNATLFAQSADPALKRPPNPLEYISVPFQNNFDFNIPQNNGFRWTMNLMPIIPVSLGKKFNFTTRAVLPVISQAKIYGETSQTGIGDLLLNTFLSPRGGKIVWGVGPTFYLPIGFPEELSAKKWAAGPGGIAAMQTRKLTLALLVFHMWSFAGSKERPSFSYSYVQPLMVYMIKRGWGLGLTSEIGLEWEKNITTGAIILTGQKTLKIGCQVINFVLGPKLFFGNFNAPEFGFRASVNLLFP
jgi:hypothetical protein